jgi:hypothetical protein
MTRNNVGFSLRVREFLAKKSITKTHWLSPCDFWLFPKVKNVLMGQRFADIPDIQHNVTTLLRAIPENDFETVSSSGIIVSWSAQLHKESISKVIAATSVQVSKFCFHRAIPGIKLSHLKHPHFYTEKCHLLNGMKIFFIPHCKHWSLTMSIFEYLTLSSGSKFLLNCFILS